MRIEIFPEHQPRGYPWHAYYGARFAWRDERCTLLRGVNGMGMGDVKLAVSLGLVVGYFGPFQLVAFGYGTIIAAVIIAIGKVFAAAKSEARPDALRLQA